MTAEERKLIEEMGGFVFNDSSAAPEAASFSLCITEDCMGPYILPGQKVYVSSSQKLSEFEVGIFYLNGKVLCRQWCEDITGALHLLAADPKRADANITLPRQERGKCLCLGRVLLEKAPPPPLHL